MTEDLRDPFLTDNALIRHLSVSKRTLRRWRQMGKLPTRRLGRLIGCFESDLRRAFRCDDQPESTDE